MKVSVYFNNEKHITVDAEKIEFVEKPNYHIWNQMKEGDILINWDNVCFMKEHKPKEEALDD